MKSKIIIERLDSHDIRMDYEISEEKTLSSKNKKIEFETEPRKVTFSCSYHMSYAIGQKPGWRWIGRSESFDLSLKPGGIYKITITKINPHTQYKNLVAGLFREIRRGLGEDVPSSVYERTYPINVHVSISIIKED